MSFVLATPELVASAAQDLAGISSALGQATAAAAGPTSAVLAAGADEVSAAIAQLFGTHGQEFQAISAQAAAFHEQFVGLLNAGAGAYASAEASATQTLLSAASAPSLFQGLESLVTSTSANLHSLESAIVANPTPLLSQLLSNQLGYGQQIATGFANAVQNLPAELANVPASLQGAVQALATANPGAVLQGIVNNQIGYANLISTSLQHAGTDLVTGLGQLPASFQAAGQAFAAGDVTGGLQTIGGGLLKPFFSGFEATTLADGTISITPLGAAGDLLPIFSIPGQMAQNFTNLLPAGSIPAQMSQNFTNIVKTLTDTSVTSTANVINDPATIPSGIGFGLDLNTHMGLPLALAIDALGGPVNGLSALNSSAAAFLNAAQAGDVLGAATAAFNTPADVLNGFLNGQVTVPLNVTALGFPTTLDLPLSGILVNPSPYTAVADSGFGLPINGVVTGTPLGGIVPGLLNFLPQELAAALGGPVPVIPQFPPLG
ncbi:hypothetical protein A5634_20190 [Mycobacterium asiaticum]|uniref:PE domain-containing protein n=1 Tax=Mycobacterium asiaticum TaxID=1790 RepID=A0A1A3P7I4_MYCAS|nr:PE family protein [Mycobacterium asiaticum]OBK28547.1 hypothetical protein A5634_20190 [Mycobacterium asiaticum]